MNTINNTVLNRTLQLLKKNAGSGTSFSVEKYQKNKSGLVAVYTVRDIVEGIQGIGSSIYNGIQGIPAAISQIKSTLTIVGYTALNGILTSIKTAALALSSLQKIIKIYRVARPLVEKVVDIAQILFYFANIAKVAQDVLQYIHRLAVQSARNILAKLWSNILSIPIIAIYKKEDSEETIDTQNAYEKTADAAQDYLEDELSKENSKNFEEMVQIMNIGEVNGINNSSNTGIVDVKKNSMSVGYENSIVVFDNDIVDVFWYNNDVYVLCDGGYKLTSDIVIKSEKNYYDENKNLVQNPITSDIGSYYDRNDWVIYKGRDKNVLKVINCDEHPVINKFFIENDGKIYIQENDIIRNYTDNIIVYSGLNVKGYLYGKYGSYVICSDRVCAVRDNSITLSIGSVDGEGTYDRDNESFYIITSKGESSTNIAKIIENQDDLVFDEDFELNERLSGLCYFQNRLWSHNGNSVKKFALKKGFGDLKLYKSVIDNELNTDKTYYRLDASTYTEVEYPNNKDILSYYEKEITYIQPGEPGNCYRREFVEVSDPVEEDLPYYYEYDESSEVYYNTEDIIIMPDTTYYTVEYVSESGESYDDFYKKEEIYFQTTDTEVMPGKTYYSLSEGYIKVEPSETDINDLPTYYEKVNDNIIFNKDLKSNGHNIEQVFIKKGQSDDDWSISSIRIGGTPPGTISSCSLKSYIIRDNGFNYKGIIYDTKLLGSQGKFTLVLSPIEEELSNYYEYDSEDKIYFLTSDTEIESGKNYYTLEPTYDLDYYSENNTKYYFYTSGYWEAVNISEDSHYKGAVEDVSDLYEIQDPVSGDYYYINSREDFYKYIKTDIDRKDYMIAPPSEFSEADFNAGYYYIYDESSETFSEATGEYDPSETYFTKNWGEDQTYLGRINSISDIIDISDETLLEGVWYLTADNTKCYWFGGKWTSDSGKTDNYIVATVGSNIICSKGKEGRWSTSTLKYVTCKDGEIKSEYPESVEMFIGNVWDDDLLYLFSQNRVYCITDIDSLFRTSTEFSTSLSDTIIYSSTQQWVKDGEKQTIWSQDIDFDAFVEAPSNCIIQSGKVISRNESYDFYVGLFNTVYKTNEESQERLKDSNIYFSGIYKVERNSNTGELVIPKTPVVYSYGRKVYDFCYNISDNTWYFMDEENVYHVLRENNKEADIIKIDNLELEDGQLICSIDIYDDSLIVFCNDGIKYQLNNHKANTINTQIKMSSGRKDFYYSEKSMLIKDGSHLHNMIAKRSDIKDDLYQSVYEGDNFKVFQSANSCFLVDNNRELKLVPEFNKYMVSSNFGCGYYTDTAFNDWFGIAPYYFMTNAINNAGVKDRTAFLTSLRKSWASEFRKFLKYAANSFLKFSEKKLITYLLNLGLQIEEDESGLLIEEIIKLIAESTSLNAGMYIADRFETRAQQEETVSMFVSDLLRVCLSDATNDITTDFYRLAMAYFYNILKEGMMAYYASNSYEGTIPSAYDGQDSSASDYSIEGTFGTDSAYGSFEYWLLQYYQVHKVEWYNSIMSGIVGDYVDYSVYSANFDEQFKIDDNDLRHGFYDELLSLAEERITSENVAEAKRQAISLCDDILSQRLYDILPSDYWKVRIKASVADYKSAQEEQYEAIIKASNMYPIQWDELPVRINRETFDYALTMLLDLIKEQIIAKIIMLILSSEGVLCYSCVDSNTVIDKILEASRKYYKNQVTNLRNSINNSIFKSVDDIKNKFNILGKIELGEYTKEEANLSVNTGDELKKILDNQTRLFAKYTDKIVYEQVVNNSSEVEYDQE